jgi:hypothetical protein
MTSCKPICIFVFQFHEASGTVCVLPGGIGSSFSRTRNVSVIYLLEFRLDRIRPVRSHFLSSSFMESSAAGHLNSKLVCYPCRQFVGSNPMWTIWWSPDKVQPTSRFRQASRRPYRTTRKGSCVLKVIHLTHDLSPPIHCT